MPVRSALTATILAGFVIAKACAPDPPSAANPSPIVTGRQTPAATQGPPTLPPQPPTQSPEPPTIAPSASPQSSAVQVAESVAFTDTARTATHTKRMLSQVLAYVDVLSAHSGCRITALDTIQEGDGCVTSVRPAASMPSPTPTTSPSPVVTITPAGTALRHIKTWAWYGSGDSGNYNFAGNVPAATMVRYFDGIFCGSGPHCTNFKNAGGTYEGDYEDPTYAAQCNLADLSNILCGGGSDRLWKTGLPSLYYIESNGSILTRSCSAPNTGCQIPMNMASPLVQAAWAFFLATNPAAPGPRGFNTEFSDDAMSNRAAYYYGFSGTSPTFATDASIAAAEAAMIRLYPPTIHPIINSLNSAVGNTANVAAVLTSNTLGDLYEICVQDRGDSLGYSSDGDSSHNVATDSYLNPAKSWSTQMNMLLYVQSQGKLAICYPAAGATSVTYTPARIYLVASLWQIFDPRYTVVWSGYEKGSANDTEAMPEFGIVPGIPIQSPGLSVSNLKVGSVYRREFMGCAYNGSPIGNCAAVVNATNGPQSMPALTNGYSKSYVIGNAGSLLSGGSGTFSGSVPGSLPGGSGVLLAQ